MVPSVDSSSCLQDQNGPIEKRTSLESPGVYFNSAFSLLGFPGSSAGKESAYNAGDPSSIPGLGRSPGEGIGYPLQYLWASLVTQLVKNPPAIWETWIRSLGWEDPLERERLPTPVS